ncbi:hypothetical protein DPMN_025023 [Dreissena polymorpha]|uniref:NADPH:adrenodoxin oxidoreductase, mitochondrial n=1 Tax=Dreissena polymorpha TaxID=45954 RepID=A0A9D4RBG0_DREPO|nr:hypothetical protein DPMN_025023 [Dreissena polymorpha]
MERMMTESFGYQDHPHVLSARNFVGWYNGLPEDAYLNVHLDTDTAVVLGHGNVALDVARILLTPVDLLAKTDITQHSLEVLRGSRVRRVVLVGRRGPLQVAFTIKELREMTKLPGTRPLLHHADYDGLQKVLDDIPRPRKRLTELLYKAALSPSEDDTKLWKTADREWELRFRLSPIEVLTRAHKITGVKFAVNNLEGDDIFNQRAVMTSETETIECGLVLRSIGYKGRPIDPAVPFDTRAGIIPNREGRVTGETCLYCSGWVGRGPVGVINNTMADGFEVGKTMLKDIQSGLLTIKSQRQAIMDLLKQRGIQVVKFKDWETIDKYETQLGEKLGKPREKETSVENMLRIAAQ